MCHFSIPQPWSPQHGLTTFYHIILKHSKHNYVKHDALLNSLMVSTISLKVKTTKRSWGAFPSLQHFEGRRVCWSFEMGLRRMTSGSIIHTYMHKLNNKLVSACWNTFSAWTSHGQTWTHKTHHGSDLGEATTFPLIIFFVPSHKANT
jgi:hypothetical protein